MSALIQSAINVSEGRRPDVIEAVAEAVRRTPGARLADYSADEDHNRMVVTILGGPSAIRDAALAVARVAVERIDLRTHSGAHPRIGAVDVIPITPLRDISLTECVPLAREIGQRIGDELSLPVYYYEASAERERPSDLPALRKGGFEGLFSAPLVNNRRPGAGPRHPHPSAGAVVVGARPPLVAYNIDLETDDVNLARRIAGGIRRERDARPELAGVRALGLWLPRRGRAQVSMNITRTGDTPLPPIFDYIRSRVRDVRCEVWRSEVIGLLPRAMLGGEPPERIMWQDYRETQVLEYWLNLL
jgi:glutamate formiminotransferase / 5-formyltetrahydrofolate cyclo-ligase